ncbi:hypothetical protein AAU57_04780 [Nonlabens sp. YIK11]|nr:hypothetical protein AAU57_04780 [Nonlabens sp. YIK11]
MKTAYRINLIVLIINCCLAIELPTAMLFMIVLGCVQIISSVWLTTRWRETSPTVRKLNIYHLVAAITLLVAFFLVLFRQLNLEYDTSRYVFIILIVLAGILAFLFTGVLYKASRE